MTVEFKYRAQMPYYAEGMVPVIEVVPTTHEGEWPRAPICCCCGNGGTTLKDVVIGWKQHDRPGLADLDGGTRSVMCLGCRNRLRKELK